MKKSILTASCSLALLSVLAGCDKQAPQTTPAQPEETNAAPAKSAQEQRVDAIFADMDTDHTPGCAVSVMKEGEIIYKNGYGMSNLEHDIPITPDSVFHIASVSKQFTVFAIALLVEQGKLSWDDEIQTHIPELPTYKHKVTLRHLAHNISGIKDQWELLLLSGWRVEGDLVTQRDAMRKIINEPELNFTPGDQYAYSNSNFTLLAEVVHKVSGKTLRDFTDEQIFKPLNMANTHFHDDHQMVVKNRTHGYAPAGDKVFKIFNPDYAIVGATSLFTTVEDMAKWDKNFYNPIIGKTVGIPEISIAPTLNDGTESTYARAMFNGTHRGLTTLGHSGGDAGYRTDYSRYTEQDFSVAVFCNTVASATNLGKAVAEVYLEEQMIAAEKIDTNSDSINNAAEKTSDITLSKEQLGKYVGIYRAPESNNSFAVVMNNDQLALDMGFFTLPLTVAGENQFEAPSPYGTAQLALTQPDDNGNFTYAKMVFGSATQEGVRTAAPLKNKSQYIGNYYSETLDTYYSITQANDGTLKLSFEKFEHIALTPKYEDGFGFTILAPFTIQFTRDEQNSINGFTVSGSRAWNIHFQKLADSK